MKHNEYDLSELTVASLFKELGKAYEDSRPYPDGYMNTMDCGMQDYLGEKQDEALEYLCAIKQEFVNRGIKITIEKFESPKKLEHSDDCNCRACEGDERSVFSAMQGGTD